MLLGLLHLGHNNKLLRVTSEFSRNVVQCKFKLANLSYLDLRLHNNNYYCVTVPFQIPSYTHSKHLKGKRVKKYFTNLPQQ